MVDSAHRYLFAVNGWIINPRQRLGARCIHLYPLLIGRESRLL